MINFTSTYNNIPNTTIEERLSIVFNPVTRPLNDWRTEVLLTAKHINNTKTKPLMLSLSGGIDAEVAARAFLELNIPFEVFSVRHTQGTNDYDIKFARDFCNQYNIKHHIHEIDYVDFWTNSVQKYIDQGYRANSIFRFLQLLILDTINNMGYTAVLGSGDQQYKTINGQICLPLSPPWIMPVEWCRRNNVTHYPYFYMSNPEVFASWMKTELVEVKLKDPAWFVNVWGNASLEKQDTYHKNWPDMPRRSKTDGFEKMRAWKISREKELISMFPDIVWYYMPVSTIKQQLGI